jgi:hypothetical protein
VSLGYYKFSTLNIDIRRRNSAVGIATGYWLDDGRVGVEVPVGSRIFSFSRRPDCFWVPTSHLSNMYRGLFPPGREVNYSLPSSAEVKNGEDILPLPPYVFMV